jgi:hypothetical protein
MGRVRVATCSGPAEAALVRAAFEAHGIPLLINAEHHANMLAGLGGAFVPLHVYVAEDDAEQAAALMQELRAESTADDGSESTDDDGEPADDDESNDAIGAATVGERVERRRKTGVVMLLALCVTFGTAHLYAGATLRAIILAAVEALGIRMVVVGDQRLGALLVASCMALDLVGALWRVRAREPAIPPARIRR